MKGCGSFFCMVELICTLSHEFPLDARVLIYRIKRSISDSVKILALPCKKMQRTHDEVTVVTRDVFLMVE
jgi:hypothetical protein